MGNYARTEITNKGKELVNQALAGNIILKFTRIGVGGGQVEGSIKELTSLVDEHTNVVSVITSGVVNKDGTTSVYGKFSNKGITEPLYINEIGLFAEGVDGEEVLYAYITANGKGDYLGTGEVVVTYESIEFITQTDSVTNILFNITEPKEAFEILLDVPEFEETNVERALIRLRSDIDYKPDIEVANINHNLGFYPIIQVLSTQGAFGIGGYGELPYGGYDTITVKSEATHEDRNNLKVLVPKEFNFSNPTVYTVTEGLEYTIGFDDSDVTLIAILSGAKNVTINEVVEGSKPETNMDSYTKSQIDYKLGQSTFRIHVDGGEESWDQDDPNTCYIPTATHTWLDLPAKKSMWVDANNSRKFDYYISLIEGAYTVSLVNDIANKVSEIEAFPICLLSDETWSNASVRLIIHAPDVPESEYRGNVLKFTDKTILIGQGDFVASNGQRNSGIVCEPFSPLQRNQETGELMNLGGWIVRFQIYVDQTYGYISDKSRVTFKFKHR